MSDPVTWATPSSLTLQADHDIIVNAAITGSSAPISLVSAPGGTINFLWMMAANREREDRQYGVVNVQPEFAAVPSGLDKGR